MKRLFRLVLPVSLAAWALVLFCAALASADEPLPEPKTEREVPGFSTDAMMTGDWGGARRKLHDLGLDLALTETSEILGNTSGGIRRRALYEGQLLLAVTVDFEKIAGWKGLTLFANGYQIHGQGLSGSAVNNFMTVSSIEALRTTRLYDLWLQQNMFDNMLSLRVGQISADDEYAISQNAAVFINAVFGWPTSFSTNMVSGGPSYPLATPGGRLRLGAGDPWSLQTAVFDGDPGGHGADPDPQVRNRYGTTFNLDRGVLSMSEFAYAINSGKNDTGLPGTYKVGFWYHSENFADLRYDATGRSLADPAGTGIPRMHRGNYGAYGVADQTVWRNPKAPDQSLGAFVRFFVSPEDRNLAAYQIDGGLNLKGLLETRKDDVLGIGVGYLRLSNAAAGIDHDNNLFNGTGKPVRDYESVIEVTYQAAITPWLSIQPDFQYVMHPGGNMANARIADGGLTPIRDAAVWGLRATVKF